MVSVDKKRILMWSVIGLLVAAGLLAAFWPRSLAVDLLPVTAGPMQVTVRDEGETRVADVFVLSAPITGRLRRIEVEPGDTMIAGENVVAEIEPTDPDLLDPRSEAEARAQLSASESATALARAETEKAEAELKFARAEVERARELARDGTLSARDLEVAETTLKTRVAAMAVAQAALQVREYELERVRAQLLTPTELASRRIDCECLVLTSPVNGRVLRVLRESEGVVSAGTGLVEIGDPGELEIVVDLLSMDAVRVRAGQKALIENWGGDGVLDARVRRVEPFGFTKTSALGIEEQRVNVVLDIVSPGERWEHLGHGYQVDVRIVLWEGAEELKVPITALFREGERWALFVSEEGRAVRRLVEIGRRTSTEAEITHGLATGEEIVVYPGEGIREGVRIVGR
jgi:HlyD family secretion protein